MSKKDKDLILVVDDNATNIDLLVDTLKHDYRVSVAKNGYQALDFVAKRIPDIILLDILMPEMDGYETCRRLKASPHSAKIPVIFITAMSDKDNITKGFEIGGVDYITKPFYNREVLARIRTHLSLKKMAEQLNAQNMLLEQKIKHLHETREQLSISAHQAGMAEIAVSILHNIGNAINSVNIRTRRLEDQIDIKEIGSLNKIHETLLTDIHQQNFDKSKKQRFESLLSYFETIIAILQKKTTQMKSDLESVRKGLDHILEIIMLQQKYASGSRGLETNVDLNDLIQDSIDMYRNIIEKQRINLKTNLTPLPPIVLDKNKMVQIFLNILKNAYEAIDEGPPDNPREIEVKTEVENLDDQKAIVIKITDTGIGFGPEIHSELFKYSYSTKGKGTGVGLHDSANYIMLNNGQIDIFSKGIGLGARLIIKFPVP